VRQAVTTCLEVLSGCKSYLGAGKTSIKKKLSSTAGVKLTLQILDFKSNTSSDSRCA